MIQVCSDFSWARVFIKNTCPMGFWRQANLGTLWRSAFQLGAAGIFQIGCRFAQVRHHSYPTENAHKVVLQESIPSQIRQLILHYYAIGKAPFIMPRQSTGVPHP